MKTIKIDGKVFKIKSVGSTILSAGRQRMAANKQAGLVTLPPKPAHNPWFLPK